MTTARIYARTGADAILPNQALVRERTAKLDADALPYLGAAGRHIATLIEVGIDVGMQAAVALAPHGDEARSQYVCSVVGEARAPLCEDVLKHIESSMTPKQRERLHTEIARAVVSQ